MSHDEKRRTVTSPNPGQARFVAFYVLAYAAAVSCGGSMRTAPTRPKAHETHAMQPNAAVEDRGAVANAMPETAPTSHSPVTNSPPTATDPSETIALDAPHAVATPIQDPAGHALDAFYAALRRAQAREGQAHIVFYGASHVASDLYTDVLRVNLQKRFGEAGAGFLLPAKALPAYRNSSIEFEHPVGFRTTRIKATAPVAGRYGLAGMFISTRRKPASSAFSTRAHAGLTGFASRFDLYYLKQPNGGKLRVLLDGKPHQVDTASRKVETAYETIEVPDGAHRVQLDIAGTAPVQIFGMSVERKVPGVVLDTLGIPGSRAAWQLLWNDAIYREHLARRNPDLVVLAYGTNEAGDKDVPISYYESTLRKVVARVREVAPNASCLLIGPSDRPERDVDGVTFIPRPRTAEIIDTQRRVAADSGCGFFDVVAFMGGPMTMPSWVAAVPPLATPDYIHFTRKGYEELGRVLYDSLMAGFEVPIAPPVLEPPAMEPPAPEPPAPEAPVVSALPSSPQSP